MKADSECRMDANHHAGRSGALTHLFSFLCSAYGIGQAIKGRIALFCSVPEPRSLLVAGLLMHTAVKRTVKFAVAGQGDLTLLGWYFDGTVEGVESIQRCQKRIRYCVYGVNRYFTLVLVLYSQGSLKLRIRLVRIAPDRQGMRPIIDARSGLDRKRHVALGSSSAVSPLIIITSHISPS